MRKRLLALSLCMVMLCSMVGWVSSVQGFPAVFADESVADSGSVIYDAYDIYGDDTTLNDGYGIYGDEDSTLDDAYGIYGDEDSTLDDAYGIYGDDTTLDDAYGLYGDGATIDWAYKQYGDGLELIKYYGDDEDVYVPSVIEVLGEKKEVLKLGDGVFKNNTGINSATLGEGILEIGESAFDGAVNLICVIAPESLTTIGKNAFAGCSDFNSAIFYDNLNQIGDNAFGECGKLTIYCPENSGIHSYAVANSISYVLFGTDDEPEIKTIDGINYYLYDKKGIALLMSCDAETAGEIVVPSTIESASGMIYPVTEIVASAFEGCTLLEKVTLPNSITKIGSRAFAGCSATEIILPDGITVIEKQTFYNSSITSMVISFGVKTISGSAFELCTKMLSVVIPESVTEIGVAAFKQSGLTSVTIPYSCTYLGASAFHSCDSLFTLEILNCETPILGYTFAEGAFSTIKVPHGLKNVDEDYAFFNSGSAGHNIYIEDIKSWCENSFVVKTAGPISVPETRNFYLKGQKINTLVIPEEVTVIPEDTFKYSTISEVKLHDKVTEVGDFAFGESSVTTVYVYSNTLCLGFPSTVRNVYIDDLDALIRNGNAGVLLRYATNVYEGEDKVRITEYTIPEDMTEIPLVFGSTADSAPNRWLQKLTIHGNVTSIAKNAFYNCVALTDVTIEQGDTVLTFGTDAFKNCTAINNVYLSDYDKFTQSTFGTIYSNPLYYAQNLYVEGVLKTEYTVPEDITVVPAGLAGNWAKKIILHDKVTEISAEAFSGCASITDFVIPEGVTKIGNKAFEGCSMLKSVEIPDSVTTIGYNAFYNCTGLTSIKLSNSITEIPDYAFFRCTALREIDIPASVKSIKSWAFRNCTSLTKVTMHDGLTTIGQYAFADCPAITEIVLPNTVTAIDAGVFWNCTGIVNATLSDNLTVISNQTFDGCTSLSEIVIPEGVTKIGDWAFRKCRGLRKITFPESLSSVGYEAFYSTLYINTFVVYENTWAHTFATNLNSSVTKEIIAIPTANKYLTYEIVDGKAVVVSCLTTVVGELKIPDTYEGYPVTEIKAGAFRDCATITKIIIPDTVTVIGDSAFRYCSDLAEINIPEGVQKIGNYAFEYCPITTLSIPGSVTEIGNCAYYHCTSLTEITIPGNVKAIGYDVFKDCTGITKVVIEEGVETLGNSVFLNCTNLKDITLPESLKSIGVSVFENCTKLAEIVLPNEITIIPARAFAGCSMLSGIKYSSDITSVGESAFENCSKLPGFDFSENLVEIFPRTFAGCTSITSVTVPSSVKSIGESAFLGCTSLKSANLGVNVSNIGSSAFSGCSALESINIPEAVTVINNNVFKNCYSLKTSGFHSGITNIGNYAFYGCQAVSDIALNENVVSIGVYAFWDCDEIYEISIPTGIVSVGADSFRFCDNLRKVIIPDGLSADTSSLASNAFANSPNVILWVFEDSYGLSYASANNIPYFIRRKTANPEIDYGASVSGTVTYTDGTAAAGVTVEMVYDDGSVKETVTADENGAFSFTYAEVGKYSIKASDSSGNTASSTVAVKRMNVFDVFVAGEADLVMKKGYTVSGTISPASGSVTLTDIDGNVIASVTTTDGTYTFETVPNGTYIIKAETENGTAAREITVFGGDVTVEEITVSSESAVVTGFVEIEDREYKHHRRNWVHVTIYNSEGVAVASQKTDSEGRYTFSNLPLDVYSIVAEVSEMRPDRKHGYDRSHTLTGYAYVEVTEAVTYEVDTIVLYEDNFSNGYDDGYKFAGISGKVTAQGETQACEVILSNVFRHEVSRCETKNNGKYAFGNVRDGLYFITAVTESNGMGFTVVVVRGGKVFGETDIFVFKKDKIREHEDNMNNIPECGSRDDAIRHKDRIREEKRFYDSLSDKEKKQFSRKYVERLNRLSEWIADCEYTENGGSIENGGLIISGDELESEDKIEIVLNVEKRNPHTPSADGVKNGDDFIHHSIEDTAGDREIVQYYDITLSKNVNGKEHKISQVSRDTDSTGKVRITIPVPDEYKGHKKYTFVHVHNGITSTLVDLDDDPDTMTFEIDRFSTFALAYSDNEDPATHTPGDVNNDTIVDSRDAIFLRRYIAGWDVEVDEDALDINGDGIVDSRDAILLRRYIAGWDLEIN